MTTNASTPAKPRARTRTRTRTVDSAAAEAAISAARSAAIATAGPTKSDTVIKLLMRAKGATPTELIAATDWQAHSVRAFLSGLRKKGRTLVREPRKNGDPAYRIVTPSPLSSDDHNPAVEPARVPVTNTDQVTA